MSILKTKTRDGSVRYAGGTISSVFSLFKPSYLPLVTISLGMAFSTTHLGFIYPLTAFA
jgi:hypothetical protein